MGSKSKSRNRRERTSRIEARNLMVGDTLVLKGGIRRRLMSLVPMHQSVANKTEGVRGCYYDTNIEAPWTKFGLVFLDDAGREYQVRTYAGSQRITVVESEDTKAQRDAMRRERSSTGRRLAGEVLA